MAYTDAPSGRRRPPSGHRRLLRPDRRRALELLASCPQEGCSEAVMRVHGFSTEQMIELTAAQRVVAGKHRLEAGRRALAGDRP